MSERVKKAEVKPDVLLGLSAVGGLFSKEILEAFRGSTSTRPAIFALSNSTTNAECTPEEAFSIVGKNIIFASGSPFKDVDLGGGEIGYSNQGNNMYLFPGIGLGTLLSGARIISDGMLQAASEWSTFQPSFMLHTSYLESHVPCYIWKLLSHKILLTVTTCSETLSHLTLP